MTRAPTAPPRAAVRAQPGKRAAVAGRPQAGDDPDEDHADQDVSDAGGLTLRSRLGLGRQGASDRVAQLAVRQGATPTRASTASASARAGRASSKTAVQRPGRHPRRRGPGPHREALAEDDGRPDGARRHRRRRRRRHERHRHGAVGHQGQGARHAGVEPARRAGARPHPHLCACLRAGGGARSEAARHHRGQDRRRVAIRCTRLPPSARPSATTWTSWSTCTARRG